MVLASKARASGHIGYRVSGIVNIMRVLHHSAERAQPLQVSIGGRRFADQEFYRLIFVVGDEHIVGIFLFAVRIRRESRSVGLGAAGMPGTDSRTSPRSETPSFLAAA